MTSPIPTLIQPSAEPSAQQPAAISREFLRLFTEGAELRCSGLGGKKPSTFLKGPFLPKFKVSLFNTDYYFAKLRQIPELRFFVAYVVQPHTKNGRAQVYPRIFYKDLSLIWRSASHLVENGDELWIGKGDLSTEIIDGEEVTSSEESTTDLPLEIQTAVETIMQRSTKPLLDHKALSIVLRNGPSSRIAPYRDFTDPRLKAAANRRNLIHAGKSIARFRRKNDPESLVFVKGFEPDFCDGVIEATESRSTMYGGQLRRFRILSVNRKIQYIFMAGSHHAWIIPPQSTTTEISSYGLRTINVQADGDLFVPGFEYHYIDEDQDPPTLVTQIPPGFAGAPCLQDEARADASAWLNRLPVITEFRKTLIKGRRRGSRSTLR